MKLIINKEMPAGKNTPTYTVSYHTGKKTKELEIYEGASSWNTKDITDFLIDLADSTSEKIQIQFKKEEDKQSLENDAQLKTIYDLFKTFADEINSK